MSEFTKIGFDMFGRPWEISSDVPFWVYKCPLCGYPYKVVYTMTYNGIHTFSFKLGNTEACVENLPRMSDSCPNCGWKEDRES